MADPDLPGRASGPYVDVTGSRGWGSPGSPTTGTTGTTIPSVGGPLTPGPSGDTHILAPQTGGLSPYEQNAIAQIQNILGQYGFSGTTLLALTGWAMHQIIAGNSPTQIVLNLQQTPQFIARFPAIEARMKAGLPPITVAQYLSNEAAYEQAERAAGLQPNFASYDTLIARDVSPAEYSDRLTNGYLAVANADPTVVQAFQDYYGVSKSQLAAYFLDPTKADPILKQQAISAQIGGAATMAGFHNQGQGLGQPSALRLAQLGVNAGQAQQGFQTLSQESQLYNPLPGAAHVGTPLSTDALLNAQFGSDGQTKLELELQAAYNKGTTNQGSQVGTTSVGATGAGAVQR